MKKLLIIATVAVFFSGQVWAQAVPVAPAAPGTSAAAGTAPAAGTVVGGTGAGLSVGAMVAIGVGVSVLAAAVRSPSSSTTHAVPRR